MTARLLLETSKRERDDDDSPVLTRAAALPSPVRTSCRQAVPSAAPTPSLPVPPSTPRHPLNILDETRDLELMDEPCPILTNRPANILVVGDLSAGKTVNSLALSHAGYHVDEAENGWEAWQAARANHYDLIVIDSRTLGLSGLELVDQLRTAGLNTPVVPASCPLTDADVRGNRWLAVSATLPIPFTIDQVLETVRSVLRTPTGVGNHRRACSPIFASTCSHHDTFRGWGINE